MLPDANLAPGVRVGGPVAYDRTMALAGVVWHFWLAVPLVALSVVLVFATIAGYLKQVSSTRYPKGD